MSELIHHRLTTLDVAQLADVLTRRGILMAPWPSDLVDLSARLSEPESIADAFLRQPAPHVSVISAVVLDRRLGRASSVESVAAWLGAGTDTVRSIVDELTAALILWIDEDDRVVLPATYPMRPNLGEPVGVMLGRQSLARLRTIAATLSVRGDGFKQDVVDRLIAFYEDGAAVRDLVATATSAEQQLLGECARSGAGTAYQGYMTNAAGRWSVDRGLLWWVGDDRAWMPLEVTLALLGDGYTLPFAPEPPRLETRPIPTDQLEAESATKLLRFAECVARIVKSVAGAPITLLKSGEIGVRTVKQFAKDLGFHTDEVVMAFHLAEALYLLVAVEPPPPAGRRKKVQGPATLEAGDVASMWLAADTAVRASSLLTEWWTSPSMALGGSDARERVEYAPPQRVRHTVVQTYGGVPEGAGAVNHGQVSDAVTWYAPFMHPGDIELLSPFIRTEAEMLGALAFGAVTSVGRALLLGSDVNPVVAELVSGAHAKAVIGADLTAVVFGPPESGLSQFLDDVASRESTGSATTWRFGKGSVRAAFDRGANADDLLADLRRYSESGVPQALEYLIRDVARTHGGVSVREVGSVIVSDDEPLLREVAANRRLSKLGLVVLAPTVVGSAVSAARTLEALREAGYAPVERDGSGEIKLDRSALASDAPGEIDYRDARFDDATFTADPMVLAAHLVDVHELSADSSHDDARLLGGFPMMRDRYQFLAGTPTVVEYDGDVHLVHSACVRDGAIQLWNVDRGRYEVVEPGVITPV
ncbi:helicase-associated domain-containing protein [Rhodococcoides trifolii]|nr:helicase-associated domain-containing protein [Rhodococcus trifolii]